MTSCKKSEETAQPTPPAPKQVAVPTAPAKSAVEMTAAEKEKVEKQKLMDYATMEDTYINDPKAQWAATATASSTFGDEDGKTPSEHSLAQNMTGMVDDRNWTNNKIDIGFDWLELGYEKPVAATEVRLVTSDGNVVESISKIELQDTDGNWHAAWSGISDAKKDSRGSRTWFVKTFPKTTYQVKAVKYTIANNVSRGNKDVNAAQLIGE